MTYPDFPKTSPTKDIVVTTLTGMISSVPIAGGAIAGLIQGSYTAHQRQIDEEFLAFLAARVGRLEVEGESRFDPSDPEFLASLTKANRAAQETADKTKRQILAEVLTETGSWSSYSLDRRQFFLDLVVRLSVWDLRVLVFANAPAAWLSARGIDADEVLKPIMMGSIAGLVRDHITLGNVGLWSTFESSADTLTTSRLIDLPLMTMMSGPGMVAQRTTQLGRDLLAFLGGAVDAIPTDLTAD
jgi:hypothetical protein